MLKAQHPEFEMWNQGIHARSGVACADCHMPFQRVGAMKISDHHVRSPLLNINRACQTCHRWPEEELRQRVHDIQDRTFALRNQAMDVMMELVADLRNARASGVTDAALQETRLMHRRGQFLLDFIEAENSSGFPRRGRGDASAGEVDRLPAAGANPGARRERDNQPWPSQHYRPDRRCRSMR